MKHLLFLQYRLFRNGVLRMTFFDECKAALMLMLAAAFLSGMYAGSWRLLEHLNRVAIAGPFLVNKLLALVFLASFCMVIFSSLVTSLGTIFFNRDVTWLMGTPLSVRHLFSFKALVTSFYASWMVVVAIAPFLAALGQVKHGGAGFYAGTLLLLAPFLLLSSLIGIIASVLLVRLLPSRRMRDNLLLIGVIFGTGLYILFRFLEPERLLKPDGLEIVAQYLAYLNAPTAVYLPSWWITGGMFALVSGSRGDLLLYGGLLYGSVCVLLILMVALAEKLYFTGWAESQTSGRRPRVPSRPFAKRSPFGALLAKDAAVFLRDSNQWSQVLILGALILVYLFSMSKLPLDTFYLQNIVAFFNLGLIGFILSAIALRFVFPLVSLEGEKLWLLRSAPLSTAGFLKEKFVFGAVPIVLSGMALTIVSNRILGADWAVLFITCAASVVMSAGFTGLALGYGSLFPRFGTTNIARIESSPGGFLYAVTAFFYLGLSVALWALPLQQYYRARMTGAAFEWAYLWWAAAGVAALSAVAAVVPLWLGWRSLEVVER